MTPREKVLDVASLFYEPSMPSSASRHRARSSRAPEPPPELRLSRYGLTPCHARSSEVIACPLLVPLQDPVDLLCAPPGPDSGRRAKPSMSPCAARAVPARPHENLARRAVPPCPGHFSHVPGQV